MTDIIQPKTGQNLISLLEREDHPVMDLSDLEIEDGLEMAEVISQIKTQLDNHKTVCLLRPSQMLAHNLYRIGYLNHPCLTCIEIRKDEPYVS